MGFMPLPCVVEWQEFNDKKGRYESYSFSGTLLQLFKSEDGQHYGYVAEADGGFIYVHPLKEIKILDGTALAMDAAKNTLCKGDDPADWFPVSTDEHYTEKAGRLYRDTTK